MRETRRLERRGSGEWRVERGRRRGGGKWWAMRPEVVAVHIYMMRQFWQLPVTRAAPRAGGFTRARKAAVYKQIRIRPGIRSYMTTNTPETKEACTRPPSCALKASPCEGREAPFVFPFYFFCFLFFLLKVIQDLYKVANCEKMFAFKSCSWLEKMSRT